MKKDTQRVIGKTQQYLNIALGGIGFVFNHFFFETEPNPIYFDNPPSAQFRIKTLFLYIISFARVVLISDVVVHIYLLKDLHYLNVISIGDINFLVFYIAFTLIILIVVLTNSEGIKSDYSLTLQTFVDIVFIALFYVASNSLTSGLFLFFGLPVLTSSVKKEFNLKIEFTILFTTLFFLALSVFYLKQINLSSSTYSKLITLFFDYLPKFLFVLICYSFSLFINRSRKLVKKYSTIESHLVDQQNKMQSRLMEVRNLSHDIKNIFDGIEEINHTMFLKVHDLKVLAKKDKEEVLKLTDFVKRFAKDGQKYRNQLTWFYKESNDKSDVHLSSIIENIVTDIRQSEHIEIINRISTDSTVFADSGQISRIFRNLISNSIRAIKLNREVLNLQKEPGKIIICEKKSTEAITISFADNGLGIEPKDIETIFIPGFTTKSRKTDETGIGLSSSKDIIETFYRGKISVSSTPKQGTTICITIPFKRRR